MHIDNFLTFILFTLKCIYLYLISVHWECIKPKSNYLFVHTTLANINKADLDLKIQIKLI